MRKRVGLIPCNAEVFPTRHDAPNVNTGAPCRVGNARPRYGSTLGVVEDVSPTALGTVLVALPCTDDEVTFSVGTVLLVVDEAVWLSLVCATCVCATCL